MRRLITILSFILLITIQSQAQSIRNNPTGETVDRTVKLYPNPATDEITVEFGQAFADNIQLNVTNATGSLVMTRPLGAGVTKYSVATSSLTPGTYQFQFIGEQGVSVRRIAIVR